MASTKKLFPHLTKKQVEQIEDDPEVRSDREAQERLFLLIGANKFKYCNGQQYIFDERTGMYGTDEEILYYYLIKYTDFFFVRVGKKLKNYATTKSLMTNLMIFVKTASIDNEWLERTEDSSLGYVLFKNGIYSMLASKFIENTNKVKFDPDIVFHARIPWDYVERVQEDVDYADQISFKQLFDNPAPMKYALARALAGDRIKKFYFCPGNSDSGKSFFCKMLKTAFGKYVGSFNAESLAYSSTNDNKDEGQKNRWAYLVRNKRILLSNEANMKKESDGNAIKKHSGGDTLVGRTHGKEEKEFTPQYTIFCLLNDIPTITPMDDGVMNRLAYINFPHIFVDPSKVKEQSHYRPIKSDLKTIIKSPRFINGFIHIILDAYKDYLEKGIPEFDMEVKRKWTEEEEQSMLINNKIAEYFEITKDSKDAISKGEINNWKDRHAKVFSTLSSQKFNEIMKGLGVVEKKSALGPYFWHGIRYHNEDKSPLRILVNKDETVTKQTQPIPISKAEESTYGSVAFDDTELDLELDLDLDFN